MPPDAYMVADGVIDQGPAQYRKNLHEESEKYLDGKVASLRADGFSTASATVIEGDAASEIVDLAASPPQSLIAMSTHGRSGLRPLDAWQCRRESRPALARPGAADSRALVFRIWIFLPPRRKDAKVKFAVISTAGRNLS